MMSTPSLIASSNAARLSASPHPVSQHTLYTAIRADGTPPRAVPEPNPNRLAEFTEFPATVDAQCDPWPCESLGDMISSLVKWFSRLKYFAPIILLHKNIDFHNESTFFFLFFFLQSKHPISTEYSSWKVAFSLYYFNCIIWVFYSFSLLVMYFTLYDTN